MKIVSLITNTALLITNSILAIMVFGSEQVWYEYFIKAVPFVNLLLVLLNYFGLLERKKQ